MNTKDFNTVKAFLKDLDVNEGDPCYSHLKDNALAMRDLGYSWNDIERDLEERIELMPLSFRYAA